MAKKKPKLDPNPKTRDWLLVEIIKGATKSGTHKDRKKEANKKTSRKPVKEEE